ncbi:MAG TPA: cytochrome C oxidase subunit IV family protein [Acidobacteriota bacterium]|nr:cytochrome C oxidase subunit IV family protein [Acidobacteriota bacterium]
MSAHSPEEIQQEVHKYFMVFGALAVLTVVTVAVSYLDLSTGLAITLALIIATVKGSLVAGYFMHLLDEQKLIYSILLLTLVFFIVLMGVPSGTAADNTGDAIHGAPPAASAEH